MKVISQSSKKSIIFGIMIFYLLYYPPFFKINTLYIIGFFSWGYIFLNYNTFRLIFRNYMLKKFYFIWGVIIIWGCIVVKIHDESISNSAGPIFWLMVIVPSSIIIGNYYKKREKGEYDLLDLILKIGVIQGITAILALLFPYIKNFFLEMVYSKDVLDNILVYALDHRLYGYATGLTFGTPIVQAYLTMIALYLFINKNVKYALYVPILAFSAIINARSAVVIFALCFILILIFSEKNVKTIKRIILTILLCIIGILSGVILMNMLSPQTVEWVYTGIKEIFNFLKGDMKEGYFSYVVNPENLFLPSGGGLIWGRGIRTLNANKYNLLSDIGYINDIWFGGIVYCIVVYSVIIYLIRSIIRKVKETDSTFYLRKFLLWSFLLGTFILNVKMYVISLNGFSTLLIMIIILFGSYPRFCENEC